jgi:hypothetical protein
VPARTCVCVATHPGRERDSQHQVHATRPLRYLYSRERRLQAGGHRASPIRLKNSEQMASFAFGTKRAESATAACLAGEARVGSFPTAFNRMRTHILEPLHADAFLVLSRKWTIGWHNSTKPGQEGKYGLGWLNLPSAVTRDNQTAMVNALRPVAHLLVGDDVEFIEWLQTEDARDVAADIQREQFRMRSPPPKGVTPAGSVLPPPCHSWPLSVDGCLENTSIVSSFWVSALRWRTCLAMIEVAEARAGNKLGADQRVLGKEHHGGYERYKWVLRVRPDFFMICHISVGWPLDVNHFDLGPANTTTARWFFFAYDFTLLMPRVAADIAFNVVSLGSTDAPGHCLYGLNPQLCAHCLLMKHGYKGFQLHSKNFGGTVMRACTDLRHERKQKILCPFVEGMSPMDPTENHSCPISLAAVARSGYACNVRHDGIFVTPCKSCRPDERMMAAWRNKTMRSGSDPHPTQSV